MSSLVTIRTYDVIQIAHLDSAKLADEGIESTVYEQSMANIMPPLSGTTGGIRLLVKDSDHRRAAEILEIPIDETQSATVSEDLNPMERCPACGSAEYTNKGSSGGRFFTALVGIIVPSRREKAGRCARCGFEGS